MNGIGYDGETQIVLGIICGLMFWAVVVWIGTRKP